MATSAAGGPGSPVTDLSLEYSEYCQACLEEGKFMESKWYCTFCQDLLCDDCYNVHSKLRALRHHVLIARTVFEHNTAYIANATANSYLDNLGHDSNNTTAPNAIMDTCDRYKGKPLVYFCTLHGKTGDVACTCKHKDCKSVLVTSEESDEIQSLSVCNDFYLKLDELDKKSQTLINNAQRTILTADQTCKSTIKMVKEFRQEVNNVLDNFENNIAKQAEQIRDGDIKKLKTIVEESSKVGMQLQNVRTEVGSLDNNGKDAEMAIAVAKSKDRIQELQAKLNDIADTDDNITRYKFLPNLPIVEALRKPCRLGELIPDPMFSKRKPDVCNEECATICETREGVSSTESPATSKPTRRQKIKDRKPYYKEIDVRSDADSDEHHCLISGIVKLENKLVVIDNGNGKVKLVDLDTTRVIDVLDTPDSPWDVTRINDQKVAVTVPQAQRVVFLDVNEKLMKVGDIATTGKCHGIDRYEDALVVSCTNPTRIEVHSLSGNSSRLIDIHTQGGQLFSPEYIAISHDGKIMFISGREQNYVTRVTFAGMVEVGPRIYELSEPAQVAVVFNGCLLLCGWDSHNVHILDQNGKQDNVRLTKDDGLLFPQSLFYCPSGRLYVGMSDNKVKVFKLW